MNQHLPQSSNETRVASRFTLQDQGTLSEQAQSLYHPERSCLAYLNLLLANALFADAIRYLPFLLSKREAVWWGCQCVWDAVRPDPLEEARDAIASAVRWVMDPREETRKAVLENANAHQNLQTPWGCLVQAVAWTSGSLTPEHLPIVPPPEQAPARAIVGAVLLAAVQRDPFQRIERYRQYLDLGLKILFAKQAEPSGRAAESVAAQTSILSGV